MCGKVSTSQPWLALALVLFAHCLPNGARVQCDLSEMTSICSLHICFCQAHQHCVLSSVSTVHFEPCLWRHRSSGDCPELKYWPSVCYHASTTWSPLGPSLTYLHQGNPPIRRTNTQEVTRQTQCCVAIFWPLHRSTPSWKPTSTASRSFKFPKPTNTNSTY